MLLQEYLSFFYSESVGFSAVPTTAFQNTEVILCRIASAYIQMKLSPKVSPLNVVHMKFISLLPRAAYARAGLSDWFCPLSLSLSLS